MRAGQALKRTRWRGLAAALVAVAALLALSGRATAAPVPLRQVDWNAALAAEPQIAILRGIPAPIFDPIGPYVVVVPPGTVIPTESDKFPDLPSDAVAGYANLENISYGDLDGDGAEEAVIPLESGGTAGTVGMLLFAESEPQPRLLASMGGYKMWSRIENGALLISQPHYVGFEGNCCPSSSVTTTYLLRDGRIVPVSEVEEPFPQARLSTVYAFYSALSERRYEEAYAFLSPSFQSANPFPMWMAGFATTERIDVDADDGPGENEVRVQLTAVDRTAGGNVTNRFQGSWFLLWSPTAHRWLLDRAVIRAG